MSLILLGTKKKGKHWRHPLWSIRCWTTSMWGTDYTADLNIQQVGVDVHVLQSERIHSLQLFKCSNCLLHICMKRTYCTVRVKCSTMSLNTRLNAFSPPPLFGIKHLSKDQCLQSVWKKTKQSAKFWHRSSDTFIQATDKQRCCTERIFWGSFPTWQSKVRIITWTWCILCT